MPRHRYSEAVPWPVDAKPAPDARSHDGLVRESASRPPTVDADVTVPLLQAVGTGVFVGGPCGAGAGWIVAHEPVIGAGCGMLAVTGAMWCVLLWDHRRLLWATERAFHTDLNGDGRIGQPHEVRVEIQHRQDGRLMRMEYLTIPGIDATKLAQFAREVTIERRPLAVGYWTGRGAPFSRSQYDTLMSELERAGLVRDDGGNVGRQLTAAGRAILRKVGEQPPTLSHA